MENAVKLTKLARCAGCGAKVGAGVLAQLLDGIRVHEDPNLLVGFDKSDDASVYKVSGELALVQTVDFFPPIADDPYLFGQIAAANALSDVYAMGGEPKLALNLMCVPEKMPREAVHQMLRGGYDKVYEAGCLITGGHSIFDEEPKYGLAVTGFVHPDRILTNSGARPGDVLLLTKPLGVGILTTAYKGGLLTLEEMEQGRPGCDGAVPGPCLHRCYRLLPDGASAGDGPGQRRTGGGPHIGGGRAGRGGGDGADGRSAGGHVPQPELCRPLCGPGKRPPARTGYSL